MNFSRLFIPGRTNGFLSKLPLALTSTPGPVSSFIAYPTRPNKIVPKLVQFYTRHTPLDQEKYVETPLFDRAIDLGILLPTKTELSESHRQNNVHLF